MRVERHPKLNIWVREDGCIYLPQSGKHKAHWTFGSEHSHGYLQVKIAGKKYMVHRLVVETYLGDIPTDCEVDHINRDRKDNRKDNLRVVTPSENSRNRADHDRLEEQGRVHSYEDESEYNRMRKVLYRRNNKERIGVRDIQYRLNKCKTHRRVLFSDGSHHWLPLPEADAYLLIPLKDRHYGK